MRKNDLQIANFVCTFGPNADLIDYLEEIVIPAFFTDTLIRKYGDTSFYVYEPKWIELGVDGKKELAIVGRFVKDTLLKREQIIKNNTLVEDYEEMQSTPSAFFMLILGDHRLLYFGETSAAPDLNAFASTMQIYLRRVWRVHLQKMHDQAVEKITHKDLKRLHPMPTLNIVPVAKNDQIDKLMQGFERIEKIRFRLIRPNHETDASAVFQSVRDRLQPLKPSRLDVEIADSDGLEKQESISAVKEATSGLNTDVIVTGVDGDGNRIKADNDEFALKIPIENPPEEKLALAKTLYAEFMKQVSSGAVKRFTPNQAVIDKINALKALIL